MIQVSASRSRWISSSARVVAWAYLASYLIASSSAAAAEAAAENADTAKSSQGPATVVALTLSGGLSEAVAAPGLFGELQPNLRQMISRIERAAEDKDVRAVVLRIRGPGIGRGKLHELRQAIGRLRHKGKYVVADLQMAMPADYLLACKCDQIVLPESGSLMLPGVRAEVTFYKDLFDKLGLQADMLQMGDFKGAAEPYTRNQMSDAFRRQYELVVDDFFDQMVDIIATDRHLNRDTVKQLIDQGLFTARDARDAGLIDVIAYSDQAQQTLKESLGAESLKIVRNYAKKKVDTDFSGMSGMFKLLDLLTGGSSRANKSRKQKIAVVYAVGAITTGRSSSGLLGGQVLGSDTIVAALRDVEKDKSVAGIVLRIDSPGGSALASDLIWRQVRLSSKPIVASMGDMAASGGYYIAMGCDKIMAEPGTLTGSIGVVGGKIVLGGFMNKLGVTTEVIGRGRNGGILSSASRFSDSERTVFEKSMADIYQQFTSKAAEGRGMDLDRLKSLAGGRVWTGRQAKEKGLVDELGSLQDAIMMTQRLAGIRGDDRVDILVLPKPKTLFEQLLEPEPEIRSIDLKRHFTQAIAPEVWQAYRLFHEPVLLWLPYQVTIR